MKNRRILLLLFLMGMVNTSHAEMTLFAVCAEGQYLDSSASCRTCTVCPREKEDKYEIKSCTGTEDSVCSRCPTGFTWKTKRRGTEWDWTRWRWRMVRRGKCEQCGACCKGPQGVDFTCLAKFADAVGCSYDSQCLTVYNESRHQNRKGRIKHRRKRLRNFKPRHKRKKGEHRHLKQTTTTSGKADKFVTQKQDTTLEILQSETPHPTVSGMNQDDPDGNTRVIFSFGVGIVLFGILVMLFSVITLCCLHVRKTRGIGKPEMPPVPSSDEGIEVVVVPSDHGSLEGYHCCCSVTSINATEPVINNSENADMITHKIRHLDDYEEFPIRIHDKQNKGVAQAECQEVSYQFNTPMKKGGQRQTGTNEIFGDYSFLTYPECFPESVSCDRRQTTVARVHRNTADSNAEKQQSDTDSKSGPDRHKERLLLKDHNTIVDDDEIATFNQHTYTKDLLDHTVDKPTLDKCAEKLLQVSPSVEQIEVLACENIKEIPVTVHTCESESETNEPPCKLSPYDPSLFSIKVENVSLVRGPGDPDEIKSSTKPDKSSAGHVAGSVENLPDDGEENRLSHSPVLDTDTDTTPEGASAAEVQCLAADENLSRSLQQNFTTNEDSETSDSKTKDSGYVEFCERGRAPYYRATLVVLGLPESGKYDLIRNLLDLPSVNDKLLANVDNKPSVFLAEAYGTHWKLRDEPRNSNSKFDAKAEKFMVQDEVASKLTEHSDFTDKPAVLKIIEVDGLPMVFGSSTIYLMVLDITKELDEKLTESCGIIRETTQRQYLDHVLNMITTFTERSSAPDQTPPGKNVIVVLTGIDELDPQTSDADIQAFTKKVLDHLKGQYPCKYVENKIFAVRNKGKNGDNLVLLKELIMKLCESRDTFCTPVPTSWSTLEGCLRNYCRHVRKRWMSLREIQENVALPNEIPSEEVKDYLEFHNKLGGIVSDNEESLDSLFVTDPLFLNDTLLSIISMREPETISKLVLEKQAKVEKELRKGIVSVETLNILWKFLGLPHQERFVSVLMNFDQFIPCHQKTPNLQDSAKKFILPFLLPQEEMTTRHFEGLKEAVVPLQYLFHKSKHDEMDEVSITAYLPHNFLYCLLAHLIENLASWELKEMLSSGATFMSGKNGNVLVRISRHGPILSLTAAIFPEAEQDNLGCEISQVRILFERGVEGLLQNYPGLHCSVSVYPCLIGDTHSQALRNQLLCLHILGKIGEVGERPLRSAICFEHKRNLPSEKYTCWFCNEMNQGIHQTKDNRNDQQILNDVAKSITDLGTLRDAGIQLGVDYHDIERTVNDSNQQIKVASFKVLYKDWYCREVDAKGDLQPGTPKRHKLKLALDACGLKNVL